MPSTLGLRKRVCEYEWSPRTSLWWENDQVFSYSTHVDTVILYVFSSTQNWSVLPPVWIMFPEYNIGRSVIMQQCFHKPFPMDVRYPAICARKKTSMLQSFASPTVNDLSLGPLARETLSFASGNYMKKSEQTKACFLFNPQYPGGEKISRIKKWKWRKIPMGC